MEVVSCVKEVIRATKQFQVDPSDSSVVALQRQLDVLVSITKKTPHLGFLNPRDLLAVECLTCIVDLLNSSKSKPSLAQKAMQLIFNLAEDAVIRKALCETFHVVPCLASYLRQHLTSFSDPVIALCLQVLQKVAYGAKFNFEESYVDGLLDVLLKQVMNVQNQAMESCLGLLASMCRNNFSIQTHIKHKENAKLLYKRLMSYLSSDNYNVVVFCLSILLSLCLNQTVGDALFGAKNVYQTFMLMFSILHNNDSPTTLTFVVDLFIDALNHAKLQHALSVYSHLATCLKEVFARVTRLKDPDSVAKLLELLLAFCLVDGIRSVVCRLLIESSTLQEPVTYQQVVARDSQFVEPFFAIIHFAAQSANTHRNLPLLAVDFLKEIYEELLLLGLNSSVSPRTDLVVPMIVESLTATGVVGGGCGARQSGVEPPHQHHRHLLKVRKTLQLLKTANCDESFRLEVAKAINVDACVALVKGTLSQAEENSFVNDHLHQAADEEEMAETLVDVVLLLLDTMLDLERYIQKMGVVLLKFLQDQTVVTAVLSRGLVSPQRDQVQIALSLVVKAGRLAEFPLTLLGDSLVAQNAERSKKKAVVGPSGSSVLQQYSKEYSWGGENKENTEGVLRESSISNLQAMDASNGKTRLNSVDLDESVAMLIDRMRDGMGLNELRTSEIISVYDHKLNSLTTKENHLQDLLEAKSLALEQADRLIAQYRCRKAQADAEAHKMRSLIHDSEKQREELREAVNDATLEKERLTNDVEQLAQDNARLEGIAEEHRELAEAYTEQTQRLEHLQKSLTSLKKEHKTMTEMHEMLRRHNETLKQQNDVASEQLAELEEDRKSLARQLKEKEAQIADFSKSLKKTETRLKKFEKDREELEVTLDKLTTELSRSEDQKKELQRQLKTLEVVCHQHEGEIRDKEEEIRDKEARLQGYKSELEKHTQLAALIHNLSSGKTPTDLPNVRK